MAKRLRLEPRSAPNPRREADPWGTGPGTPRWRRSARSKRFPRWGYRNFDAKESEWLVMAISGSGNKMLLGLGDPPMRAQPVAPCEVGNCYFQAGDCYKSPTPHRNAQVRPDARGQPAADPLGRRPCPLEARRSGHGAWGIPRNDPGHDWLLAWNGPSRRTGLPPGGDAAPVIR